MGYEELQNKIQELDNDLNVFIDEHENDKKHLEELKAKLLKGGFTVSKKKLGKEIQEIKDKIEQDEYIIKEYEYGNKTSLYKGNEEVNEIANNIIKEGTATAGEQEKKHSELVEDLKELKKAYLQKIADIGDVVRANKTTLGKINKAKEYTNSDININSLKINERIGANQGIIYLTKNESDFAYDSGYDKAKGYAKQTMSKGYYLDLD